MGLFGGFTQSEVNEFSMKLNINKKKIKGADTVRCFHKKLTETLNTHTYVSDKQDTKMLITEKTHKKNGPR
jgi:hypothetical protein